MLVKLRKFMKIRQFEKIHMIDTTKLMKNSIIGTVYITMLI